MNLTIFFNRSFCRPDLTPVFKPEHEREFVQNVSNLMPLIFACCKTDCIIKDPVIMQILSIADRVEPTQLSLDVWNDRLEEIVDKGNSNHGNYLTTSLCDETLKLGYETYQQIVNPNTRKKSGQWFTPSPVISYMVRSTAISYERNFNTDISEIEGRILEPCCGVGSFVVAMLPYFKTKLTQIDNGVILACEIDPIAAFLARLNISDALMKMGSDLPFDNILCINTLADGGKI